jgi:Glucodextranase, domain B
VPDQPATVVREQPVGETPAFIVAQVPLAAGRNEISATVAGPGSESDPSPSVTYVLDTSKPSITISSPKNKAKVNAATVTIKGKTQGRSEVVARNDTSGAVATATAKSDGTFAVKVGLGAGTNTIKLTVTDPAGNAASKAITIRRGAIEAAVKLTASTYRLSAAKLPRPLVLTAVVTDPSGRPIPAAPVTFTVSVPGVPAITGDATTNASGVATFRLTVPKGATTGSGPATALATTDEYGDISTSIVITIVR